MQQFRPTTTAKRYMRYALPALRITCVTGCLWVGRGNCLARGGAGPRVVITRINESTYMETTQILVDPSIEITRSCEAGWAETSKHHLDFSRGRFVILVGGRVTHQTPSLANRQHYPALRVAFILARRGLEPSSCHVIIGRPPITTP